jgi:hypothetical protein
MALRRRFCFRVEFARCDNLVEPRREDVQFSALLDVDHLRNRATGFRCSYRNANAKFGKSATMVPFDDDIHSYECQVLDVSPGGAKLAADIDAMVGNLI